MKTSSWKAALVCGTVLAGLALPGVALAQSEAQADDGAEAAESEILVTGSRIKRDGFTSPVLLTVVDAGVVENLGQTNAAEVVRLLPQNIASQSDATSGITLSANAGSQFANLRGLNPTFGTRTLALVNTRRFMPSSDGGQVDLNLIPSVMIGRVETVTGGASAAYGSDAVAGVVNIILDNKLQGFKGQIDYGQTSRADGKSFHGAAAYGTSFGDGRGHIIVGGEYQRNWGIPHCSLTREWCAEEWLIVQNAGTIRPGTLNYTATTGPNVASAANTSGYDVPGSPGYGLPNYIIAKNGALNYNSPTGAIRNFFRGSGTGTVFSAFFPAINPPAGIIDMEFNEAGTALRPFDPGLYGPKLVGASVIGGSGSGVHEDQYIQTPVNRYTTYLSGSYELTDSITANLELTYAKRKARSQTTTAANRSTMPIKNDNAYLPASVAALMPAGSAFSIGKDVDNELANTLSIDAEIFRGVVGLSGKLMGDWTWDAYYQYGKNNRHSSVRYSRHNDAFTMAIDAIRNPSNPSQIICRPLNPTQLAGFSATYQAQLNALYAACKPLNIFGVGNMSPEAIAFAWRPVVEDFKFTQNVVAASAQGSVFDGWGAGPVGAAVGVEYRTETGDVTHGGVNPNDYAFSFGLDYAGKIKVFEAFGEANIPVFKDFAIGRYFEINGALRHTRNTASDTLTSQSRTVGATSWKVGGIYDLIDGLRFRGTRSRDIRAPGFRELFLKTAPTESGTAQGRVNNSNITGPNKADATPIYSGGNFTLTPEIGNTLTLGTVVSPSFLPGFQFSVDWYRITLDNAIANLQAQRVADLCNSFQVLCDRVTFASPTDITRVDAGQANVATMRIKGVDIEASYRLPLSDLKASLPGTFGVRLMLNHQYDFRVQYGPGTPVVQYAGQSGPVTEGGDFYPTPKWMWNALISYDTDRFNTTLTVRHIGKGILNVERIGPEDPGYAPTVANSITFNRVKSATYFNIAGSYKIPLGASDAQYVELFTSVENLFDKKPPVAPGGGGNNNAYPTNPVYFDTFGMRWKTGLRLRF